MLWKGFLHTHRPLGVRPLEGAAGERNGFRSRRTCIRSCFLSTVLPCAWVNEACGM